MLNLARKLAPRFLKNVLKIILNKDYREEYFEVNRLKKMKRYQPDQVKLLGRKIVFPDAASYLFTYDEIFRKEIYRLPAVTENPVILDCGANIGLSVIYLKNRYPEAGITAFEADPGIFRYLTDNLRSFGYEEKIQLINKAVWSKDTVLRFQSEGADGGRVENTGSSGGIEIPAIRLKPLLNRKIDFLKMDIEGAETEVLLDCGESIRNIHYLFIEYHSFTGRVQTLDQILTLLKENDFRYYLEHNGVGRDYPFFNRTDSSGMDSQINIWAENQHFT